MLQMRVKPIVVHQQVYLIPILLACDQGPQWGKRQKTGSNRKNIGERSQPSGLGRGKRPPFPLPRLPPGSLRSPIFFPFFPNAEPGPRILFCFLHFPSRFSFAFSYHNVIAIRCIFTCNFFFCLKVIFPFFSVKIYPLGTNL